MKATDLTPWFDYFKMCRAYEDKGFLEIHQSEQEAYITVPAIHAISKGDDIRKQFTDGSIRKTVRGIRVYALYKTYGEITDTYRPFALHVVKDTAPHDLLYTLLITFRRCWWWPWRKSERIYVVTY